MRRALLLPVLSCLICGLGALAAETMALAQEPQRSTNTTSVVPVVGQPLAQALRQLREEGLPVVFTSGVVPRSLRVREYQASRDARRLLEALLAPHDLVAEPGPGATLVIRQRNSAPEPGSILGELRSRHSSRPVALGTVLLSPALGDASPGPERRRETNGGGVFRFTDVTAGRHQLSVLAEGFAPQEASVTVAPGAQTRIRIDLQPQPYVDEEIAVRPGEQSLLLADPTTPLALGRGEIASLPHLAGDAFRALSLLPGVVSGDYTAAPRVHGGRRDEVQVVLDGQELYDAYHLQDFDSGISLVASDLLESAHLQTGGFPAARGDRMSGVLELTTRQPTALESRLSLSLLTAEVASGSAFATGGGPVVGSWYGSARLGSIEFANRLFGREDPSFWDAFGKVDLGLGARHQVRARILRAGDSLDFRSLQDGEAKGIDTRYDTGYLWLTHQAIVGSALLVETTASKSSIERDRRGFEAEEEQSFDVFDGRLVEVEGLRSEWTLQSALQHTLTWGAELRDFDAEFDYRNGAQRDFGFVSDELTIAPRQVFFAAELAGRHLGGWVSHRFSLADRWFLEAGLRADRHELVEFARLDTPQNAQQSAYDDSFLSPRVSFAYAVDQNSVLRASWGLYHQTQRPYELQVESGESQLARAERAEHAVIGYERTFVQHAGARSATGLASSLRAVRIEAFHREIDAPRPRFESLFEPFNVFREVEPDRALIVPSAARAYGLELSLRGGAGRRSVWLLNYSLARSEDRLTQVRRWIPRDIDQTHTLNVSWSYRPNERWTVNLAGRFHTGWPTTPLASTGAAEDGATDEPRAGGEEGADTTDLVLAELGPLRSQRLGDYHRLDLRIARRFVTKRGDVHLFLDVQNLYDRKNPAGFDHSLDDGRVVRDSEVWPGILPSLGVSWTF